MNQETVHIRRLRPPRHEPRQSCRTRLAPGPERKRMYRAMLRGAADTNLVRSGEQGVARPAVDRLGPLPTALPPDSSWPERARTPSDQMGSENHRRTGENQ